MLTNPTLPIVTPGLGDTVAKEVYSWIGAFRQLVYATIVSYRMQDYPFWDNGRLSDLLLRQLSLGAQLVVMTTPPSGKTGVGPEFKRKFTLLETLANRGADIYLHTQLHAKAYLFTDSNNSKMLIVGSPNLTEAGFGGTDSTNKTLLELALLTADPGIYSSTLRTIQTGLIANAQTVPFPTWASLNRDKIARAKESNG